MAPLPSDRRFADLCLDLQVERSKLDALVLSLATLQRDWQVLEAADQRCFVQIVRVLNGGPPDGADWHRRLLQRMGVATEIRPALLDASTVAGLAELMRFRHVVRHLYAYELEREQVSRLLQRSLELWPAVAAQLKAFETWLTELSS